MSKPHSRRALWIQRLTNEVSLGVTQQIRDGALPPRAPLPSLEVMPVLSITTHTVIERAQKNPSDTGLIAQAAGGGYCVSASPQPVHECALPDTAPDRLEDVLAILELRLGLEAEGPALAAERRDAHQMAAIKAAAQAHADSTRTTSAAHRRRTGGAQAAHRRRTGGFPIPPRRRRGVRHPRFSRPAGLSRTVFDPAHARSFASLDSARRPNTKSDGRACRPDGRHPHTGWRHRTPRDARPSGAHNGHDLRGRCDRGRPILRCQRSRPPHPPLSLPGTSRAGCPPLQTPPHLACRLTALSKCAFP
jgi:DNA-binding transcriptional regulator YhcF (GntR family)